MLRVGRGRRTRVYSRSTTVDLANLLDSSTNGFHLTLAGSGVPTVATDPWGIGLDGLVFSGQNAVANGANFALGAAFTIDVRFKRNVAQNGVQQAVLARYNTSPGDYFLLYFENDNTLKYFETSATVITSAAITDGNAHSARVVHSGGNISLYVDGSRVAGPTASTMTASGPCPFRVGNYDDVTNTTEGALPFSGTLGEIHISNIARSVGASYSVANTPAVADANTIALLKFDKVTGTYLGTPVFQSNVLLRSGHSQASGGWANPDGPFQTLDGKWAFTASAYNGAQWTVWAVIANTLSSLLAGSGTLQGTAIQTPGSGEGDIAGNGTVYPWNGVYHHLYHDNPGGGLNNIRHSSGADLNSAYPQGTIIFTGGTGGYDTYADPFVRPVANNPGILEMFISAIPTGGGTRQVLRSTSTDAINWTAVSQVIADARTPGWPNTAGEPSAVNILATQPWQLSDGAQPAGTRRVQRFSNVGGVWLPAMKLFGPDGAFLTCYDPSSYFEQANLRLDILATHSTNTNSTQPTDAEIGLWFVPVVGL